MAKIILESWNKGLKKVSLTKLQVEKLGLSLKESKGNVDFLLENKKIILEIDDSSIAKDFYDNAKNIGVNCTLIP